MAKASFRNGRLLLILAAALLLRLWMLRYHWAVGFDEAHYVRMARAFAMGKWEAFLHPYWPPMYPAAIGILLPLFRDPELAARLVNVLAGVLLILPVYHWTRRIFSDRVALWSAGLLATFPPMAFNATTAMTEPFYTALTLWGIWFGWKALEEGGALAALAAGLLFGAAYLTKPEGFGYWMVFVALAGLAFLWQRKALFLRAAAWGTAAFFLTALPYLLYLHAQMGTWTLSMKFRVNQEFEALGIDSEKNPEARFSLNADNTALPTDQAYHEGKFHSLPDQPPGAKTDWGRKLKLTARKYVENFYKMNRDGVPALFTLAPLALFILGLYHWPGEKEQALLQGYLLAFVVFFWFAVIPMFHLNLRYLLPQLPICFLWMGGGFTRLTERIAAGISTRRPNWAARAWLAPLVFLALFSYLPELGRVVKRSPENTEFWGEAVELKQAGRWLKEHAGPAPVLMSFNKAVDYYAGGWDLRQGASFPINPEFDRIMQYARHKGVQFLVLSERYRERFPNLQFLIEQRGVPKYLEKVYESAFPAGLRTLIYKIDWNEWSGGEHGPQNEEENQG